MTGVYTVFYDARCAICRRGRAMIERLAPAGRARFVDLNDAAAVRAYPELDPRTCLGQMWVQSPAGRMAGGYDAFTMLVPALPLLSPLAPLMRLGPVRAVGDVVYRWVARNRYRLGGQVSCHDGACAVKW